VRSGNLRKSITRRIEGDRGNPVGRVGTNLIYARIHELGGTIRPVRAKYLHFRTTDGGWIKTKKVIIPRRPYMAPSLSENLQKIVKIIRESVMEGFKWASATGY
jgi:phage gpG-like protein